MNNNFFVDLQIKHHKGIFYLGVLLFTVTFVMLFALFAQLNAYFKTTKTFRNVNDSHILYTTSTFSRYKENRIKMDEWEENLSNLRNVYISNNPSLSFDEATEMAIEQIGDPPENNITNEDLKYVPEIESVWYCGATDIEYESGMIYAISNDFADRLSYDMKKGKWLSESKSENNIIDVVVIKNSRYDIGDIIPLSIWQKVGDDEIELKTIDLSARVIGICDYDYDLLSLNVGSNDFISLSFNHLSFSSENLLLSNYEDIKPYLHMYNLYETPASTGLVVKLKDNLSSEKIESAYDHLTQRRISAISFEQIYRNTINEEKSNFGKRIILFVIAALYSIISIISLSVFQLYRNKKQYKIYYICGMPIRDYMKIHLLYELKSIILSLILSSFISLIMSTFEYVKKYASYIEYGYNESEISAWISFKDFIYITPITLIGILGLALIIVIISTLICSYVYNIEKA